MTDFVKALLIGVGLTLGLLTLPILAVIVIPLMIFASIVVVALFVIKVVTHEDNDDDTHKPP
jgi:hypothetical protein